LEEFLLSVVNSQENYSIKAFEGRTKFSYRKKRTMLFTHSFYLLTLNNGEYHTLSFSAVKPLLVTKGEWILNKKSDTTSYRSYIQGKNFRDVVRLFPEETVDARQTLINVIHTINSGVKYYYRDHLKTRPDFYNCNTALYGTIDFVRQPASAFMYLVKHAD